MPADTPNSNLPGKKKWETPIFFIIDSNQPEGGGHAPNFVERSAKNGNFYIRQKNNPGSKITVGKAAFDNYEHS